MIGLIILGLLAVLCGALAFSTVMNWMSSKKELDSDYGILVKKWISSGKYNVVTGVFSSSGELRDEQVHESVELDDELKQVFGRRNKVQVEI